jgi:hypothetical protein
MTLYKFEMGQPHWEAADRLHSYEQYTFYRVFKKELYYGIPNVTVWCSTP